MKNAPSIESISQWIRERNPLGIEVADRVTIEDIDPKAWSGHFNYLISTPKVHFVLRFKGPEWGDEDGIRKEYRTLKAVGLYGVGPTAYDIMENFFGEPVSLIEHLKGNPLSSLPGPEQFHLFPGVVDLMVKIAKIPHQTLGIPITEGYTSYGNSKKQWRKRLEVIKKDPHLNEWTERLERVLPSAEIMLDKYEPQLRKTLEHIPPSFIFTSAHAGHCLHTSNGLRFINWEKVGVGDPSFMLSVFLASIGQHKDFATIKRKMLTGYLEKLPSPDFETLVDQRLAEREISNLIWSVWNDARKNTLDNREKYIGPTDRYDRVVNLLRQFT